VFINGGKPPSAVTMSDTFLGMKPEERRMIVAQVRQDMADIYGGPENMGKPALLPPGLDWKPIGGSVVEAALVEQRKLTREEVAAVYLIPPPLMGILDRATYANIGVQREMTYTDCLGPPLILLEQSINAQIIRDLLQEDDVFVEFDFGGVLRGDRLAEIDALRDAIATALLSPNEGRAVLNLPQVDIPAMDEYWMPTNNLSPMSLAAEGEAAPAQPETASPEPGGAPGQPPSQFETAPEQAPAPPQKGELIVVEGGRQYHLTPA
jgi:HK97 family phage portal protein